MVSKLRKNNNYRIYEFEFGTITERPEKVTIDITHSQFSFESVEEIKNLATKNDPLFLPSEDIINTENSLLFSFSKSEQLKNMVWIKHEEYPIKLTIIETILKQDILGKYEEEGIFISLNPATLYYYPMETVRYTYSGNLFMPRNTYTHIERYRALTVSVLSDIPYEKCLMNPKEVSNEANSLIREIYQQTNLVDLLLLVQNSRNYITYNYIQEREGTEKKIKKTYQYILGGVVVLSLVGFSLFGAKVSKEARIMANQYEELLTDKDLLVEANEAFYGGNYDKAIKLYQKIDYDNEELTNRLIENNEYQKALETDSSALEKVIQTLYESEQTDLILELNDEPLEEKERGKLADEQGIINEDTNVMMSTLNFLSDENTASRLLNKFIQLGDFTSAETIIEKYPENKEFQVSLSNALEESEARAEIELQLEEKKAQLEEEDDEDTIKQLEEEIQALEDSLS